MIWMIVFQHVMYCISSVLEDRAHFEFYYLLFTMQSHYARKHINS